MKDNQKQLLQNYRVVVLRAKEQSQNLATILEKLGAEVVLLPMIFIAPDSTATKTINEEFLARFDTLIFTSVNCVKTFMDTLLQKKILLKHLDNKTIVVIGPKTHDACLKYGVLPQIMPETFDVKSLLEYFTRSDLKGKHILMTKSTEASCFLKDELENLGAEIDYLSLYQNVKPETKNVQIDDGDLVLFMSPSSADRFFTCEVYKSQDIIAFCIGNTTAETVKKYINRNIYIAQDATAESLIEEVINYASQKNFFYNAAI